MDATKFTSIMTPVNAKTGDDFKFSKFNSLGFKQTNAKSKDNRQSQLGKATVDAYFVVPDTKKS